MEEKKWQKYLNKKAVITLIAILWSAFHLYTGLFGLLPAMTQRSIHLAFALLLGLLVVPISKKHKGNKTLEAVNIVLCLITLVVGVISYFIFLPEAAYARTITGPTQFQFIIAGIILILILEITRRTCFPLMVICVVALVYSYFGPYMPGLLSHKGYAPHTVLDLLFFSTEGIFGTPLGVSATFIVLFIILGAFLEKTGAGQFFVDIAFAATGRSKSGPAMSAVVSSALMGTISGSTVANVVTTGSFTIPLMKQVGFTSVFAGAVSALASTGGQFMPPVMGAAAFIMAEALGTTYSTVALAAAIPAILFYVACGFMIHFEASKMNIRALSKEELPNVKQVMLKGAHFIVPLALLIYWLMVLQWTATKAAVWTIVTTIIMSYVRKESRMTPKKILEALAEGGRNTIQVASACAAAGIVIGVVTLTGLGLKFSYLVISLAGGKLLLGLLLTMVACIILGMGLPTAASYIITASLGAPALIEMGVAPLAAHMFVLYFACLSSITPPVALAAYAGAAVADADAMKTGFAATRLGITAFIVPYMFVYGNELLGVGNIFGIIQALATAVVGTYFISIAVQGYFVAKVNPLFRLIFFGASLCLLLPGTLTDVIGIGVGAICLFICWKQKKAGDAKLAAEAAVSEPVEAPVQD